MIVVRMKALLYSDCLRDLLIILTTRLKFVETAAPRLAMPSADPRQCRGN